MLGRLRKLLGQSQDEAPAAEAAAEGGPEREELPAGPLPAPSLELLRFDEILTFRTRHLLPLHTEFQTEFEVDGDLRPLTLRARTREDQGPAGVLYTADVEAEPAVLQALKAGYGPEVEARGGREERRAVPRVRNRIRVRSRHLPHFQGLTHDLSPEGLRLVVDGEVAPGSALDLELQLDHDRLPDVRARAEAIWNSPREGRSWWVGARFTELPEADRATLVEYLEGVAGATDDGLTRKNFLD